MFLILLGQIISFPQWWHLALSLSFCSLAKWFQTQDLVFFPDFEVLPPSASLRLRELGVLISSWLQSESLSSTCIGSSSSLPTGFSQEAIYIKEKTELKKWKFETTHTKLNNIQTYDLFCLNFDKELYSQVTKQQNKSQVTKQSNKTKDNSQRIIWFKIKLNNEQKSNHKTTKQN